MNVAICGGGTGGHLHPLLALAQELVSHEGIKVTLYLSRKSPSSVPMEKEKVILLEVSGFSRGFDLANLKSLAALLKAFSTCRREMRVDPPGVAVSFGGYASVPGAAAALSLGVPLVIHEQNVVPGLANRLLAPWARVLAVSFAHSLDRRPGWKKKGVVTGNPLLMPAKAGGTREAREYFGLEEARMTLAVVGGSQGAASLNRAVLQALPAWKDRRDLQIIHSVGRDKYEEFAAEVAKTESGGLLYRPMEFVERMDLLYQAADLMICRAGATTISELAAAGCPAVLVPYPHATDAHQDANASVLEKAGAAVLIEDGNLSGRLLEELVGRLMADAGRLRKMGEAARVMGKPDAASILAELLLSLAQEEQVERK